MSDDPETNRACEARPGGAVARTPRCELAAGARERGGRREVPKGGATVSGRGEGGAKLTPLVALFTVQSEYYDSVFSQVDQAPLPNRDNASPGEKCHQDNLPPPLTFQPLTPPSTTHPPVHLPVSLRGVVRRAQETKETEDGKKEEEKKDFFFLFLPFFFFFLI